MTRWKTSAKQAFVSGASASVVSAIALALLGKLENDSAAGPLNGPSQWFYGRRAAFRKDASVRHTLVGYLIHHLTATGWALLHERIFGKRKSEQSLASRLGKAAVTASVANIVDYQLTPKRLQPGFEAQLSRKSLVVVYAAFAVGLALYANAASRRGTSGRRK